MSEAGRLADLSEAGQRQMRARLADIEARTLALDSPATATDPATLGVIRDEARSARDRIDARLVEFAVTEQWGDRPGN